MEENNAYIPREAPPPVTPPPARPKRPPVSWQDGLFAAVFLVLGWLYSSWLLWDWKTWSLTAFTGAYLAAGLGYCLVSGKKPAKESWFWLIAAALLSVPRLLPWPMLPPMDVLSTVALHVAAAYWALSLTGRLEAGSRTSGWLPLDLFNALLYTPFSHFGMLVVKLFRWIGQGIGAVKNRIRQGKRGPSRLPAILAGVALAVLLLAVVLPQLLAADEGFAALFSGFFGGISSWWHGLWQADAEQIAETLVKTILALPVALYLYGLFFGAIHGTHVRRLGTRQIRQLEEKAAILPRTTLAIGLGALCGVYVLFIGLQAQYLFGGFLGRLPEGFSYAGYARQGFFELCRISAINLAVLLGANLLSRRRGGGMHRLFNIALSVLTILLLATAFAKMGLYISVYGLTPKRVLTTVFLVWILAVYVGVIVLQLHSLPLTRLAVLLGAVLFLLLTLLPVGEGIEHWNSAHAKDTAAVQAEVMDN